MFTWIRHWFAKTESIALAQEDAKATRLSAASLPDDTKKSHEILRDPIEVDLPFYRWIMGNENPASVEASIDVLTHEKIILDALLALTLTKSAGANLLPRVPAIIPQLLKSIRDENTSSSELSQQLAQDVILIAEVIREANSPYYHPSSPITNLDNAVLILGHNGLRLLIARVAFRPVMNSHSGHFTNLAAPSIWAQSEKCADTCLWLAAKAKLDPFEAYLAGLIQNMGLIVAFRLIDQLYAGKVLPNSETYLREFVLHARTLSAKIAQQWDFPENVIAALEDTHIEESESKSPSLSQLLAMSDRISKLRMLVDNHLLSESEDVVLASLSEEAGRCFTKMKTSDN
jgi:HD-like signal output (HDOD) protein